MLSPADVEKDYSDHDGQSLSDSASGAANSGTNGDDSSTKTPTSHQNSSTTGTSQTGSNAKGIPDEIMASKENRAVNRSRIVVLFVLLSSATIAGVMTWYWATDAEQKSFESQFEDLANEIEDVSKNNAENIFRVAESFSTSVTSAALAAGETFPNVTIPHFEVRGEAYRLVTNAVQVAFTPIVTDLDAWNEYSWANQGWIQDSYDYRGDDMVPVPIEKVYSKNEDGKHLLETPGKPEYCPLWQESAAPHDTGVINYNMLTHPIFEFDFDLMRDTGNSVLSKAFDVSTLLGAGAILDIGGDGLIEPESLFFEPVYDSFDKIERSIVGAIITVIPWDLYFQNLVHEGSEGLVCVLRDTCGGVFTYKVDGPQAKYRGIGDHHNPKYDYLEQVIPFGPSIDFSQADDDAEEDHCRFSLHIFPTQEFEDAYHTNGPAIFTVVVIMVFIFTTMVFVMYDYLVQRRQDKVQSAALRSNAIVSSLFPAEVRERLYQQKEELKPVKSNKPGYDPAPKFRLKSYLDDDQKHDTENEDEGKLDTHIPEMFETKPIADLFPATTVMFADIAGFTAWSSVREPSQVFTLLETVYRAFDMLAKKRRVFKVETVGDCYVAVTGLPEPRKDHAVVMARFARDCMTRMNELSHQLEVTLGPDTGDLAMRFGLHSGPVTAGVLRGEKSRFQLFGDTVNTAARIESTGLRNRIHISQETADQLKAGGKEHWFVTRTDTVVAKGKGEMQTYWLLPKENSLAADFNEEVAEENELLKSSKIASIIPPKSHSSQKIQRLVDWNVDVLKRLLKLTVAKRNAQEQKTIANPDALAIALAMKEKEFLYKEAPLDEFQEIVTLPAFDAKTQRNHLNPNAVQLPPSVVHQLRAYVEAIAVMYRETPFHNFEHASHVTMSVSKLLSRIVAPDIDVEGDNAAENLHDHTYGITSDPMTQFAVVLSALIHDVDHVGIPNYLLVTENEKLARIYRKKSVAEQNSVDLAWSTLMEPRFKELRRCLYTSVDELSRFRQLVVNTVLATDIFDKELQTLRKSRWEKAFKLKADTDAQVGANRKATIVIEHLIQASDVAHTMQHWHIYQKWNERLFAEMTVAYQTGRSSTDPAPGWYQGELGFFDNYIIPLAKKLQDCGVFGVSSDEYLNYALENRREWANKGEEAVAKMIEKYRVENKSSPVDESTRSEAALAKVGKMAAEVRDLPANAAPYEK